MRIAPSGFRLLISLLALHLCAAGMLRAQDKYTPLVASTLQPEMQLATGTDGKKHVVYELVLTNATPVPATLAKIEVVDAGDSSRVVAVFEGGMLLPRLRQIPGQQLAKDLTVEPSGSRLFLLDLAFDAGVAPPPKLLHRITLSAAGGGSLTSADMPLVYTAAPARLASDAIAIGSPLRGTGWVAASGCCGSDGAHRQTGMPINGGIHFAQRYAIDWLRLDDKGHFYHGDPSDVHNWAGYGLDVVAAADGTVIETLNTLEDQVPAKNPDPKTINLENIGGNHVIEDLGHGVYAFYAHLQKGSVTVAVGDHVRRGQLLGKVGNTGNSSAPHLHFHLMNGPSMLGSDGLPYLIDFFVLEGQLLDKHFEKPDSLEGDFSAGLFPAKSQRLLQLPLDLTVVNF